MCRCQSCGEIYYPDQDWKTLCLPCWKKTKRHENETAELLAELREEIYRLRYQMTFARPAIGAIPEDILKSLIRLTHPDRHGNSQAANDATAWLLSQRGVA